MHQAKRMDWKRGSVGHSQTGRTGPADAGSTRLVRVRAKVWARTWVVHLHG